MPGRSYFCVLRRIVSTFWLQFVTWPQRARVSRWICFIDKNISNSGKEMVTKLLDRICGGSEKKVEVVKKTAEVSAFSEWEVWWVLVLLVNCEFTPNRWIGTSKSGLSGWLQARNCVEKCSDLHLPALCRGLFLAFPKTTNFGPHRMGHRIHDGLRHDSRRTQIVHTSLIQSKQETSIHFDVLANDGNAKLNVWMGSRSSCSP